LSNSTPKRPISHLDSPDSDIENDCPMDDPPYTEPKKRRIFLHAKSGSRSRPPSPGTRKFITESDFVSDWNIHAVPEDLFLQWVPKNRRKRYLNSQPGENIFSAEDVKAMVEEAVEETGKRCEEEFQKILMIKLREQFLVLNTVVNENIQRQLQKRDQDYVI